jgi:hypothetical protein
MRDDSMEKDSKRQIMEEFITNLENLKANLPPVLGGFMIGMISPKIYELLSENQKKKWKEKFPIHHGEAGVVLTSLSAISRLFLEFAPTENRWVQIAKKVSELLVGIGAGLTLEDIKDMNKWFKR